MVLATYKQMHDKTGFRELLQLKAEERGRKESSHWLYLVHGSLTPRRINHPARYPAGVCELLDCIFEQFTHVSEHQFASDSELFVGK